MNIQIWSDEEKEIFNHIVMVLDGNNRTAEREQLQKNILALEIQAHAIGLYPSILASNRLGDSERDIETLVVSLCRKYPVEDQFAMPGKAVAGRAFIINKVNLFSMLLLLAGTGSVSESVVGKVKGGMLRLIIDILTEDVLMELVENGATGTRVREQAARMLAHRWEDRITPENDHFNPVLAQIWIARKALLPIYGTFMGTHEYLGLNRHMGELSRSYILHAMRSTEETEAFEEFLFGIRHEDILEVKNRMAKKQLACIDRAAIVSIVGEDALFMSGENEDPMELYRFFSLRRKSAFVRRNSNGSGPQRTFEENLLVYMLET